MSVVVQPSGELEMQAQAARQNLRNVKISAPNIASGTEPGEDDERVAERVELRREHEEDEDEREPHRRQELAALLAQLPRLARVIDAVPGGRILAAAVLEHA